MKRILLSTTLLLSSIISFSQVVLNEVYTIPSPGRNEFFELYNTNPSGDSVSVDCFTIITYYEEGTKKGWYVMDLPALKVGPKGYFTGASANPFNVQGTPGKVANFNWNAMPAGGKLEKWEWNGAGGYNDSTASIPIGFNDFFYRKGGGGANYTILIYINGVFANGFLGGSNTGFMDVALTNLPNLPVDMLGSCTDFSANFALFKTKAIENVNASAGTDNGYYRKFDGSCGAWDKSSNAGEHTPGITNGSAALSTTSGLITTQSITCATNPGNPTILTYNITGVKGETTVANDFPVEVQLYYDFATVGVLDGADVYQRSKFRNNIGLGPDTFQIQPQNQKIILVYITSRGCLDKVVVINNTCTNLPVTLTHFNAIKASSGVQLNWQTAVETNNEGFEVQRKSAGGEFEAIGFVPSSALNGTTDQVINYSYQDNSNNSGYVFYRLKQRDLDGTIAYSETRVLRNSNTSAAGLNIFPNPATGGKATIVLEGSMSGVQVMITDLSGKVIRVWENQYSNTIQAEGLKPGIYLVKAVDKNTGNQRISKLVVQ